MLVSTFSGELHHPPHPPEKSSLGDSGSAGSGRRLCGQQKRRAEWLVVVVSPSKASSKVGSRSENQVSEDSVALRGICLPHSQPQRQFLQEPVYQCSDNPSEQSTCPSASGGNQRSLTAGDCIACLGADVRAYPTKQIEASASDDKAGQGTDLCAFTPPMTLVSMQSHKANGCCI